LIVVVWKTQPGTGNMTQRKITIILKQWQEGRLAYYLGITPFLMSFFEVCQYRG
jgi:hypothetical protein